MIETSSEGLSAFEQVLRESLTLVRPPERLTVSEWADKYGMLSPEASSAPGKWYTSNAEYQRQPMDVLTSLTFQTIVLMWASQVGKTQIALFLTAYHVQHDPAPILFIEPTEDMAKVISQDRIKPMIRDTPILRALFGKAGSKDSGNDTLHKTFPGGHLTMAGAESPAQLAGRPIRILITDEEGRYKQSAGKEGDPVGQAKKRIATFKGNRRHLRISSPNLRKTCSITRAYENSDQRHYFIPCPHCGEFQTLRWQQLQWPGPHLPGANAPTHRPEDCYYVCERNGCEILEHDKFSMISRGEWRADKPGNGDGRTAGYQLSALYSTIGYTWTEIIHEYLESRGNAFREQVFTNTVLAEPWDEQAEGADLSAVQKRAEVYAAEAPAWVLLVTCGTDVQKDRIEATKWGWGLDNRSGVIEHRIFRGDPTQPAVWAEFDEWRQFEVEHETGVMLPNSCTFVDSGDGNRTQEVYEYCRKKEKERVYATKGSSMTGAPLVGAAKRVGRWKTILVIAGASTAKDTIYSRLQIEDRNLPGYIHFPSNPSAGVTPEYYKQLTAEVLVTKETAAGDRTVWESRGRNETLDCAVYALAAKEFTRAPMKLLARKLQAKAAKIPQKTPEQKLEEAKVLAIVKVADKLTGVLGMNPAHKTQQNLGKKKKKRILRPGHAWIVA